MNAVEAEQFCIGAERAMRHGSASLADFPAMLRRIIQERLWERRQVPGHGLVELKSLTELITSKPRKGWGDDLSQVEAVIRDTPDVLQMFRKETTAPKHAHADSDNRTITAPKRGTTRAYTLDRLHREAPALYQQVVAKELSANQAAIKAGFRKVKTPLEQLRHWWAKADVRQREAFLRSVEARV